MVVSVNAPKAVEEEPVLEEGLEDGEGEEGSEEAGGDDSTPAESEENKEDNPEES
jgi:hypothetical protein